MSKGFEIDLAVEIEAQSISQKEIQEMVLELDAELDHWLEEMSAINVTLQDKLKIRASMFRDGVQQQEIPVLLSAAPVVSSEAVAATVAEQYPPVQSVAVTSDEGKVSIEKLLQISIDSLRNKLSEKILAMLKEIMTLGGPMREQKILEFYKVALFEHVDLAGLISAEKVEGRPADERPKGDEVKDTGVGSIMDEPEKMKGGK